MNIKAGDTWCQLREVKRFHIFTFIQDYKGRALLYDCHTGEIFLVTYKELEYALTSSANHPMHADLKMFDFIETLPDDVLEVMKADTELKLKEKEPKILNLFKTCERN
jgi:hypothetical protein